MKKLIVVAFILSASMPAFAQKYMTRTGKITFNATAAKSPEKIEAVNNETASILDASSGGFVFQVLIKSFKFERELMQEHFNENYMESDKFPKATFKGTIVDFNKVDLKKNGAYNVERSE